MKGGREREKERGRVSRREGGVKERGYTPSNKENSPNNE